MNNESMTVPKDTAIHSPGELESLLRVLARLLDAGVLKQSDIAGTSTGSMDLRLLRLEGPWPDILEAELIGADGRRYRLFVDTFHGAGGYWRVLDGDGHA